MDNIIHKQHKTVSIVFKYNGGEYLYEYHSDRLNGSLTILDRDSGKFVYASHAPELITPLGQEIETALRKQNII